MAGLSPVIDKLCNASASDNGVAIATILGGLTGGPLLAVGILCGGIALQLHSENKRKATQAELFAKLGEHWKQCNQNQQQLIEQLTPFIKREDYFLARLPGYEKADLAKIVASAVKEQLSPLLPEGSNKIAWDDVRIFLNDNNERLVDLRELIAEQQKTLNIIAEKQKEQATKDDLASTIAPVLARNEKFETRNAHLATALHVTQNAVSTFFAILNREDIPQDKWPQELAQIAVRHRELLADIDRVEVADESLENQKQQALAAIEGGDYDLAEQLLIHLQIADLDAAKQHQQTANARFRRAVQSTAILADLSMTRIDYQTAATRYAEAADLVRSFDADACNRYLWKHADALYTLGLEKGDNDALQQAIISWIDLLTRLPRERVPLNWATTQNSLGNALLTLGARESGTERLEESIKAYQAALKERTRECAPLAWAETQNNLGNALQTLGARESGTERLDESVKAYQAALEERMRDRVPLNWATTQNNLGAALFALGERESGTERLEQSVDAYKEALKERTRERVPLEWAAAQNNLGNTLAVLGERERGAERLEQSVDAYRAALKERTRKRVPLDWAMTQNNLGNVLQTLGKRESGMERLEEAVEAFEAALKEYTRERVPLNWAMTQSNLGNTLLTLGARESGTERLDESVKAYQAALKERTRERVPLGWAATQNNLGAALRTLGERENSTDRLGQSVDAYRSALEVFEEANATYYIEGTRRNLDRAERLIEERRTRKPDDQP